MTRKRNAATLLETLIVIAACGFLLSMSFSAIQRVRAAADQSACAHRLRQLVLAIHLYESDHQHVPPGPGSFAERSPNRLLSWMALLLPYLEQDSLYRESVAACAVEPDATRIPHRGFTTALRALVCAADGRLEQPLVHASGELAAYTSFIGAGGCLFPGEKTIRPGFFASSPGLPLAQMHDGLSNTIAIGERPPPESLDAGWWYPGFLGYGLRGPNNLLVLGGVRLVFGNEPCPPSLRNLGPGRLDNPCDRFHFWSLHGGGANFAFADGSVRFMAYSADAIVPALSTVNGGEPVVSLD